MYDKGPIDKDRFHIENKKQFIDAIEVSDKRSIKHFITYYVHNGNQKSNDFTASLKDILPMPGYHDPGFFHRESGGWKRWKKWSSGGVQHHHILLDHQPTGKDVIEFLDRAVAFSDQLIHPDLIKEIEDYYNGKTN